MNRRLCLVVSGDRYATATPQDRRTWSNVVLTTMERLTADYHPAHVVLIHGAGGTGSGDDARREMVGIDALADSIGRVLGFAVIPMPANWAPGKVGGPRRNSFMLDVQEDLGRCGYETVVVACHDHLLASKGTRDCVAQARSRRLRIVLVESSGAWSEEAGRP